MVGMVEGRDGKETNTRERKRNTVFVAFSLPSFAPPTPPNLPFIIASCLINP